MPDNTSQSSTAVGHGFELRKRRRWLWVALAAVVIVVAAVVARLVFAPSGKTANDIPGATLYVGAADGYPADKALIDFVAREVAPRYGIKVGYRGISDSTTINRATSDGEIAGNIFQHGEWLRQVLEANPDFRLTATRPILRQAFGIWSDGYRSVADIPDGATISLMSDPSDEALGLWYLAQAGLITLDPKAEAGAQTQKDIVDNPRHLKFVLVEYGSQPRTLRDVAAAAGWATDFLAAGIPQDKLIFAPPTPDQYSGVLTVGTRWIDTDNIKNLIAAFEDPAVQQFLATSPEVKGRLLPL